MLAVRRHSKAWILVVHFALLVALSSLSCAQRVRIGAEVLIEKYLDLLANKRVGIICNHTSVLPNGTHLVDTLLSKGVHVTALFGPEHGIRGIEAEGKTFDSGIDEKTGLPVHSLYGKTKKPTAEMLKDVDVLLFDIQDVGARFYTYASTMALAMEAAAEQGKRFIVLDRPNPINGIDVRGPVLDTTLKSFVGMFPISVRHGMTLGELAKMIVGEKWLSAKPVVDLVVIAMEGWRREMWYDETGLPWIPPSPNMKTLATATVYPGTCLFEGTNISEGRGTEKPFEYIGAPWMNGDSLASRLGSRALRGVEFTPIRFTPQSLSAARPKYAGVECGGVSVTVKDRGVYNPFETAIKMLAEIHSMYPDSLMFKQRTFDQLAGSASVRRFILGEIAAGQYEAEMPGAVEEFKKTRQRYLSY